MTYLEKAIKDAIKDGGWEYRGVKASNFVRVELGSLDDDILLISKHVTYLVIFERILLMPTFWQALGKAMGWDKRREESAVRVEVDVKWFDKEPTPPITGVMELENRRRRVKYHIEKACVWAEMENWEFEWHRFIDHLAEGKDIESFFATISTNN